MDRRLIERWTQTTVYAVAVCISGVVLLPVLAMGIVVSAGLLVAAVVGKTANFSGAVIVVLSLGGSIGLFGCVRARFGVHRPARHNVMVTMVCLAIGITTALAVAVLITVPFSDAFFTLPSSVVDATQALLVVAAPLIWVFFGIGWMQKLARRYAEEVGHAFDGTPAMMLLIAIALATAASLIATAT